MLLNDLNSPQQKTQKVFLQTRKAGFQILQFQIPALLLPKHGQSLQRQPTQQVQFHHTKSVVQKALLPS